MKVGYQSKESYVVWHIEGGLGKNIAATSLVSSIKQKYSDRKFIIIASYPEIFLNFPEVHRVYATGNTPYFYQDYIEEKDTLVFRQEGYFQTGHISKQQHLIESWCQLLDLEYTGQQPVLLPNLVQKRASTAWMRERPVMILQTNGGPLGDDRLYSWTRDMPPAIANQIAQYYSKDYHIIQICRNEKEIIPGVESITQPLSNFELISALAVSQKRVLIDSSLQHAAAALKLPSTVLWIGTSPKVFGYDLHTNVTAGVPKYKPKLIDSYLFDYSFEGRPEQCPYDSPEEMFSFRELVEHIDKTGN
jgi:uncharacterized phage-like protein YoqJ